MVVDDLAMGITEVVRGADLLSSSPRQVLLAELLARKPPGFAHAPLIVSGDGARLAKRERGISVRDHRSAGATGPDYVARLVALLGLLPASEVPAALAPGELLGRGTLDRLRGRREARVDASFALPGA